MSEKEAIEIIDNLSDDIFIKVIRKSKNRIKKIKEKRKVSSSWGKI